MPEFINVEKFLEEEELGGPGSGHHGHKGTKGSQGGSTPKAGARGVGVRAPTVDKEAVFEKYRIWSPTRGGGAPNVKEYDRMMENSVKDPKDIAHRYKRKGVLSHKELGKLYEEEYREKAIQGALVVPKSGPFKSVPLTVLGVAGEGKKGDYVWDCAPLFKIGKGKWDPKTRTKGPPTGKGKLTGWHIAIPADDL